VLDLRSLNREQMDAVLTTEGPLLVLAGAGSGKTRVITYRLAHLIERGVSPKSILCVTFTNKAAFEMRDRAKKLVGKSVRGATMSTFHALGARILREHSERVGLRSGFTISDASDQMGTLKRVLRAVNIDDHSFDAKRIMAMISRAKNAGVDAARFRAQDGELSPAQAKASTEEMRMVNDDALEEEYRVAAIEAYERYEDGLRAQNVVDFDDLLLLTEKLLQSHADVLQRLQSRWRYLMIDEYQDTNGAQFQLMRLLAGATRNLCVVGDDDQSIYGWRGAEIENILRFSKHFPGAKVVKLETNYRSTGNILSVANAIIAKNPHRHEKTLRAHAGTGDPVKVVAMEDDDTEADQVASGVLQLIADGVTPKDIAILFRSNVQSRPIELAFRREHIAYRVVGGMELFDRKEIKDALAYLRVLDNPDDEQSLRRIINYPPRGIGDQTIERIDTWARARGMSLLEGLTKVDEIPDVQAKASDAIVELLALLSEHRSLLRKRRASTVAAKLIESTKLEEQLFETNDNPMTASRRVDNVREIVKQIERYEERKKVRVTGEEEQEDSPEVSALGAFLADLALSGFEDGSPKQEREDQVVLSTIHAAKGLEWHHVYVVGCEEDLLPHAKTVLGEGGIEEERRLAYVAVTRARKRLTMTWAEARTKWGRIVPRKRSRFLDELPEGAVEVREGSVMIERSEAEKDAIAKAWRAKIRAQLGISEG
jgi:ATP-dependent DNA helicase UvrD/PcrA